MAGEIPDRLALIALTLGVTSVVSAVGVFLAYKGDLFPIPLTLLLVGLVATPAAIVLAHIARARSGRVNQGARGRTRAFLALVLGYTWFAIIFLTTFPDPNLGVFAFLGLIEAPHVFVRQFRKRLWLATLSGFVLTGCVCYFFGNRHDEVSFTIGFLGLVTMALLPGWILFDRSPGLSLGRKLSAAGLLYLLTVVGVWKMWETLK